MLDSPRSAERANRVARSQRGQVRLVSAGGGSCGHLVLQTVELLLLRLHGEVLQVAPHLVPLTPRVLAVLGRDERSPSSDPANGAAGHAVAGGGRLRVRASLSRAAG